MHALTGVRRSQRMPVISIAASDAVFAECKSKSGKASTSAEPIWRPQNTVYVKMFRNFATDKNRNGEKEGFAAIILFLTSFFCFTLRIYF